jgi:hypothetical protein
MRAIISAASSFLTLVLWASLSYGQNSSPQPSKQAMDPKLYPREVTDLPNFTQYDYARSPRDPFLDKSVKNTLMGEDKTSVLDKLVLVSWLDEAGKIVIFVQNTETNDVQKVTSEPNKDHFRIVEIHPNADPNLFEAVISNGSEKGPVRFRLASPDRSPQNGNTNSPPIPTKKPQIAPMSPTPSARKN